MKTMILLSAGLILLAGCSQHQPTDPRVHAREGVGSDSLTSNIVTRPIQEALNAITGRGIVISNVLTNRNDAGLLDVQVNGYNESMETKRFRYRFEWLDETGRLLETKTSVWQQFSVTGNQPFSIRATAPRTQATTFRMDTRSWEN
jgi:uncharacterized protein YcfL